MSTAAHQRAYVARQLAARPAEFRARRNQVRAAWQRRNRAAHNAHNQVYYAITTGKLTRPAACEQCHEPCRPQAHHDDYTRPLDVRWLCPPCHGGTRTKED